MHEDIRAALDDLLSPRTPTGRVLVTGWFSFPDGEVTAGDALAQRTVSRALDHLGVGHDTAWSPVFAPGELSLESALPGRYEQVLFVCGPVHGEQVAGLHQRYAACRRLAVGVSVVDPGSPAVTGFHRVLPREAPGRGSLPDLATAAGVGPGRPLAGVALTMGQGEYGARRRHTEAGEAVLRWLARKDCARVEADTRLARDDWRLCRSADQYLSLVGKLDVMVTNRLHGLVLSLRMGVPVLALDPVRGGAKVTAQADVLGWPALLACDDISDRALDDWWEWCLSPAGSAAARRLGAFMVRNA
ncbi:polysaccharide pyruvyl transferase family protein [Streptomyces sp. NPDC001274]